MVSGNVPNLPLIIRERDSLMELAHWESHADRSRDSYTALETLEEVYDSRQCAQ